jgi:predicted house-cleaning NTP pyrophosphatase (Maf/HAM1 superfamily)
MIGKIAEMEGEERDILIEQIANQMKKSYLAWNKDAVEDDKIFKDLRELTKGEVNIGADTVQLTDTKSIVGKPNKKKKQQQQQYKKK